MRGRQMKSHKEWPWQQLSTVPQSTRGFPSVESGSPLTWNTCRGNLFFARPILTSMTCRPPLASSCFQGCFRVAFSPRVTPVIYYAPQNPFPIKACTAHIPCISIRITSLLLAVTPTSKIHESVCLWYDPLTSLHGISDNLWSKKIEEHASIIPSWCLVLERYLENEHLMEGMWAGVPDMESL